MYQIYCIYCETSK